MGAASDKLNHLAGTKTAIREAIAAKGVDVPEATPFRQYATKIAAIPQGSGSGGEPSDDGWTRPADRPAPPWGEGEIPTDNTIYMLFGVMPAGPNDYAIALSGAAYTANWGDGTSDNYASGAKAEHLFDYASLNVAPNAEGIKWVWMKFAPTSAGNFTTIDHAVRHSSRPAGSSSNTFVPQVYEMYLKATQVSTWGWITSTSTKYSLLNIFYWYDANKIQSFNSFLSQSCNLKLLRINTSSGVIFSFFLFGCDSFNQELNIDTGEGIYFDNFLASCYSFNQELDIDTGKGIYFDNFLASCYSFNRPLGIDTRNGTNFNSFLTKCSSFNQPLNINTGNGSTFNNFLAYCYSFNKPLNINTHIGSSFASFMYSCYSFNHDFDIDTSNGTNFNAFMNTCSSFNKILNIYTSKGKYFDSFMARCSSFSYTVTIDLLSTASAIGTSSIGAYCYALTGLRLLNMGSIHTALYMANSNLSASALTDLFNDLCDRTGLSQGTITITNCYGASKLTAAQRAIATNKNWTIVG